MQMYIDCMPEDHQRVSINKVRPPSKPDWTEYKEDVDREEKYDTDDAVSVTSESSTTESEVTLIFDADEKTMEQEEDFRLERATPPSGATPLGVSPLPIPALTRETSTDYACTTLVTQDETPVVAPVLCQKYVRYTYDTPGVNTWYRRLKRKLLSPFPRRSADALDDDLDTELELDETNRDVYDLGIFEISDAPSRRLKVQLLGKSHPFARLETVCPDLIEFLVRHPDNARRSLNGNHEIYPHVCANQLNLQNKYPDIKNLSTSVIMSSIQRTLNILVLRDAKLQGCVDTTVRPDFCRMGPSVAYRLRQILFALAPPPAMWKKHFVTTKLLLSSRGRNSLLVANPSFRTNSANQHVKMEPTELCSVPLRRQPPTSIVAATTVSDLPSDD